MVGCESNNTDANYGCIPYRSNTYGPGAVVVDANTLTRITNKQIIFTVAFVSK